MNHKTAKAEGTIKSCVRRGKYTRIVVDVFGQFVPTDKHIHILTDPDMKTRRQLNFFYGICKDIGEFVGEHFEEVKASFKKTVGVETIKHATRQDMIELIDLAIEFCKTHEIPLSKKTVFQMEADKRVDFCTHFKVCLVCGNPADTHHVDVIGMGRDRKVVDKLYPDLKKLPLCREHHGEVDALGVNKFVTKHHLQDYRHYFERTKVDYKA